MKYSKVMTESEILEHAESEFKRCRGMLATFVIGHSYYKDQQDVCKMVEASDEIEKWMTKTNVWKETIALLKHKP